MWDVLRVAVDNVRDSDTVMDSLGVADVECVCERTAEGDEDKEGLMVVDAVQEPVEHETDFDMVAVSLWVCEMGCVGETVADSIVVGDVLVV